METAGSPANTSMSRLAQRTGPYLDRHFLPFFGSRSIARISAVAGPGVGDEGHGASSCEYHVMLHSIYERAVRTS